MKIGDKVVCVRDGLCAYPGDYQSKEKRLLPPLKNGLVYVVSSVGQVKHGTIINLIGVNPAPHAGFDPSRFRLLSELKTETAQKSFLPVRRESVVQNDRRR